MAKQKSLKHIRLTCRYCSSFVSGTPVYLATGIEKICTTTKRQKDAEDHACENYTPNNIFYCDEHHQRLTFDMCEARRNPKTEIAKKYWNSKECYKTCKKCPQRHEVDYIIKYKLSGKKAPISRKLPTRKPIKKEPQPRRSLHHPIQQPKPKDKTRVLIRRSV